MVAQGKFWGYEWVTAFPPLAILAAIGAERALRADAPGEWSSAPRRGLVIVLLVLLALGSYRAVTGAAYWASSVVVRRDSGRWFESFGDYDPVRGYISETAHHLRAVTTPDESAVVWGMEPLIYALSDRRPATRYGVSIPLLLGGDTPERRADQARFLDDITKRLPARFVVLQRDSNRLIPREARQTIDDVPGLRALLERAYQPETTIGNATIYSRRAGP
jgi:hypothetical protein